MSTVALILAAGFGKRMQSNMPKVLHTISGDPALLWVLRALPTEITTAVVVLHHGQELIKPAIAHWTDNKLLACSVATLDQGEPLGTGHAVQQAVSMLDELKASKVVILYGDVPLIKTRTITHLMASNNAILAMDIANPTGYGRIVQNASGYLQNIVEHDEATPDILAINRVNGGAYSIDWELLKSALMQITNNNSKREYYLTDAIIQIAKNSPIEVKLCHTDELMGMNSRKDQVNLQHCAQERINNYWLNQGVTIINPASTIIGPRVALSMDVTLAQNTSITGQTSIGSGTSIGDGCVLSNCNIGNGVLLKPYCVINKSDIDNNCILGPFAHLREGSVLKQNVHIGNFTEIKKTLLQHNVKANHLSYLGDAEVGARSNLGAGVITCNYDGLNKHKTIIGKDVFLGSDCQLIAPITIGDQAIIGAGSTITTDIPPKALAIARSFVTVKADGATRVRKKIATKQLT